MSTRQPELWLTRHGETEWSRDGRHTGKTDVPLTEAGERAAWALGDRLAGTSFDLVVTSPLARARETARLAGFGDRAVVEPDVREWDYGEYEGRTTADIRTDVPGWSVWNHPVPGGESAEQVGARADRVIERILADVAERALIVAHGHFLRVLGARWLGLSARKGAHFVLDVATVSVLGWERETPAFDRWNA
ncbi:histidine phosphatase family protein [Actinopolymorpha singaporensis]|uniref:Probable phosphoglycerate mutase n=1 Tax=Actinopolymorpha singaporensis TaxID=117157 RepID=A0A1H1YSZ0_9ACTN|nr:histidine phosphatase family protein [Actinopolymorpha singaporensis]SDT24452.1 probable phosphoglycerate mutase [Actinopolymorpha singaporensis]